MKQIQELGIRNRCKYWTGALYSLISLVPSTRPFGTAEYLKEYRHGFRSWLGHLLYWSSYLTSVYSFVKCKKGDINILRRELDEHRKRRKRFDAND